MRWAHLWAALLLLVVRARASTLYQAAGVTRHHEGDTFLLRREGTTVACSRTLCADSHALPTAPESSQCGCRCPPELPVFREDLHVCVDELHECSMATFKNGNKYQKVPFVFLPMKGQIIHPSSDIVLSEGSDKAPVCVVSSAQFLTRSGWLELRNVSDMEPPLRLFRDHRRTFLQWLGEQDLRLSMEGRVLLARLMCKDATGQTAVSHSGVVTHAFSTPCVAFRVAGSQGAREVVFTPDYTVAGSGGLLHGLLGGGSSESRPSSGLSTSEGIAVGLCVLLLGLVYAASVCVYLHVRRRKRRHKKRGRLEDSSILGSSDSERGIGGIHHHRGHELTLLGEGVVKNNPLLLGTNTYSVRAPVPPGPRRSLRSGTNIPPGEASGVREAEKETSGSPLSERSGQSIEEQNLFVGNSDTKAVVHKLAPSSPPPPPPHNFAASMADALVSGNSKSTGLYTLTLQPATEGGSMERHPEESVSIVETLDDDTSSPFARNRDFSFLGGRHSMCSASLGLPGLTKDNSSRACNGSSSSNQTSPFLTGPGTVTRRKLYFNPAYFEPEMLHAPPPAALEFLQKLREVITMAKHKMSAKRFSPSLLGIPEENVSEANEEQNAGKRNWSGSHSRHPVAVAVLPDADDVSGSKQQTIRRWLEDLESGDPVEDVDEDETEKRKPTVPNVPPPPVPEPPSKRLMDAVIKELVRERGLTPADSTSDDTTNQSSEKPTEELSLDDNDYEMISMQDTSLSSPQPTSASAPNSPVFRPPLMMYCLPELLAKTSGYNLVSEVYVNDGYSSNQSTVSRSSMKKKQNQRQRPLQGSAGSSEHSSPSSVLSESPEESSPTLPGRLTIEVAESTALHYRGGYESDEFEPDTLDRGKRHQPNQKISDVCADSLERPTKILLKSSGSFFTDAEHANKMSWEPPHDLWRCPNLRDKKKKSPYSIADLRSTNVTLLPGLQKNKEFGSLREIFEAKRQQQLQKQIQELEHMWMPQMHEFVKRGATRSLVEPNELRWRSGLTQQMMDEIRELMWKSTPETGIPLPRVPPTKPKRQRSADVTASPPTPPPPIPPSLPPTLPPKQRKLNQQFPPPIAREIKPPPCLPPKNLKGSRSPHNPPPGTSAVSDDEEEDLRGGSCTLGRKVEEGLNEAFATWKRQRKDWKPEVRISHRPGDSGYLSSDSSSNSMKRDGKAESSETEDSLCESESGAESVGTDSFFFGRVRPQESFAPVVKPAGRYEMAPGTTVVHMPPVPIRKRPPPPPKRINSRLETKVVGTTRNENIIQNLSSQYAL